MLHLTHKFGASCFCHRFFLRKQLGTRWVCSVNNTNRFRCEKEKNHTHSNCAKRLNCITFAFLPISYCMHDNFVVLVQCKDYSTFSRILLEFTCYQFSFEIWNIEWRQCWKCAVKLQNVCTNGLQHYLLTL